MNTIKKSLALSMAAALVGAISFNIPAYADCGSKDHAKNKAESLKTNKKDIVETASAAGSFNTLIAALKAAELVDTLKGDGPFTVFAPTDEAFKKINSDDLNALLKDKKKLARVLTYHVVPGNLKASDVVKVKGAKTVEGSKVKISTNKSGVKVDGAKVVKTDIACKNGVVHVIDSVIMPPSL